MSHIIERCIEGFDFCPDNGECHVCEHKRIVHAGLCTGFVDDATSHGRTCGKPPVAGFRHCDEHLEWCCAPGCTKAAEPHSLCPACKHALAVGRATIEEMEKKTD